MNQPPFCQSYEEARGYFISGELQAWDGTRWEDIPKDANVFFSRRVEEYRKRPEEPEQMQSPDFYVMALTGPGRTFICGSFFSPESVANFLWGKDLKEYAVFKRVRIDSLDIKKIAIQLEKA